MSVFRRSPSPPLQANYRRYRPWLRGDFRECCAYCLMHELMAAGEENFEIDHFRPQSRPELLPDPNAYSNLYYACHVCNHRKRDRWPNEALMERGYRFIDYCEERFSQHFREDASGRWVALTRAAEYTEERLLLNSPCRRELRLALRTLAQLRGVEAMDWDTTCREHLMKIIVKP